jgi:hypothetical protein
MKVVELKELSKREATIHYIKEYTAVAVLESNHGRTEADIAFTLELKALGPPGVSVRVLDPVDWPLLPVMRAIRAYIVDLEGSGRLL